MTNINKEIEESLSRSFDGPSRFLLAVSGGPDSQVLISAFSHVAKGLGHTVSALGVNHGLRPEADSELDLAQVLCEKAEIPFFRERVSVAPGGNIQARARDERYSVLLKKAFEVKAAIVTAHHKDDLAETVMTRILRSGKVGALAVLPEMTYYKYEDTTVPIFRPFLNVERIDIESYAKRWEIPFATDPSNSNTHYTRCWLRHEVFPVLKERYPDLVDKLVSLSKDARTVK